MFRKYEKTFRVSGPKGKLSLTHDEITRLFSSAVTIEEKMDGANIGIIRHKKGFSLQKRGSLVGQSEHKQFQFFHGWANYKKYDNIMAVPEGYLLYGELLYAVHTIYYDMLPDYVLLFDIWDGNKNRWLDREARTNFCNKYEFDQVPFIDHGYYSRFTVEKLMPEKSFYGSVAEGMVIKRYTKSGEYYRGKIVKPQFIKEMEESDHWMHKEVKRNKLFILDKS